MKIGIDCRLWSETGVGRYIRNLVLNLQEIDRKNEYVLFVLSKDEKDIKSLIHNSQFIIRLANIKWHTIDEQLRSPQVLKKENLDLVHFPYFSVPIFYNKPFVVTIHDLIVNHFPTGQASTLSFPIYNLKLLAYKFVLNQAARKAKKIIAVSNATKQEIIDHLKINPQKITVTYEGVDDKISNPKCQVPNKLQIINCKLQNTKYFLYVGNAYPHKNLETLINGFSEIKSEAKLILVGKKDAFYRRLENKKIKNLIFLHDVSDAELFYLYSHAIANVSASLMEGFGLPAIEAMANKCLNLLSDIPAFKEVCVDAAVYFNPRDVNDLKEKFKDIVDHSNDTYYYSDKKEKGLERAKLFSWLKMAGETLKVYEGCVGV